MLCFLLRGKLPAQFPQASEVTPNSDIWRAAAILIQRHGAPDAALVAAQRADELLAKGDGEGQEI